MNLEASPGWHMSSLATPGISQAWGWLWMMRYRDDLPLKAPLTRHQGGSLAGCPQLPRQPPQKEHRGAHPHQAPNAGTPNDQAPQLSPSCANRNTLPSPATSRPVPCTIRLCSGCALSPLCSQVIRGTGANVTAVPNSTTRVVSSPLTGAAHILMRQGALGSKHSWAMGGPVPRLPLNVLAPQHRAGEPHGPLESACPAGKVRKGLLSPRQGHGHWSFATA